MLTRVAVTLFVLGLLVGPARAELFFVPIDGSRREYQAEEFGYQVRAEEYGGTIHVVIDLDGDATTAFKDTRLVLKKGKKEVFQTSIALTRDAKEKRAQLVFEYDPASIDGGELIVYSVKVKDRLVPDFGGFSFSIEALTKLARGNHTSAWGEESNGLRLRVRASKTTEQGMPLDVRVELSCDPKKLKPKVKSLNELFFAAFFELELVNPASGKRLTVKPYDPTAGGPAFGDTGRYSIPLDGRQIDPWKVTFPLVMLGDTLAPGSWTIQVRYSFPEEPTRWWAGDRTAWDRAGFWHGTIRSGTLDLEVSKETPKTRTFWLPKRLRLEKGLDVSYHKEDAEEVVLPVRNGYHVATYIWPGRFQGALEPGAALDRWQDNRPGDHRAEYTIEIFETPDPPAHMWHPRMTTLWKKTLTLTATEAEIERLSKMGIPKEDKR